MKKNEEMLKKNEELIKKVLNETNLLIRSNQKLSNNINSE